MLRLTVLTGLPAYRPYEVQVTVTNFKWSASQSNSQLSTFMYATKEKNPKVKYHTKTVIIHKS